MKLSQVITEVLDAAEESGVMFLYVDLELLSLKSGHKRSRFGLALSAAIKHTKWTPKKIYITAAPVVAPSAGGEEC